MYSLEASYVEKFRCDGSKCDSKCCRKWIINVDDDTLKKYEEIRPKEKSKEITKHIGKLENFDDINVITLTEDESCPFIDEDFLCFIQKNYGETYLSSTCATYPRLNFLINDDFCLRSLTLSCPVAAHLVLNQKGIVTFNTNEVKNFKNQFFYDMRPMEKGYMMPLIEVTGANILQYKNLSIDQRLGVLALFLESAYEAKNEGELADISETFENDVLKDAKTIFLPLKFNKQVFLKTMFPFIRNLFVENTSRADARLYAIFINRTYEFAPNADNLNDLDADSLNYDELEKFYNERFLPAKETLLKDNSLQIENFLLHFFLASGAPLRNNIKTFSGAAAKFVLEYKLAEFAFVCLKYAKGEKFCAEDLYHGATDLTTILEHNIQVSEKIDEKYRDTKEVTSIIQQLLDI